MWESLKTSTRLAGKMKLPRYVTVTPTAAKGARPDNKDTKGEGSGDGDGDGEGDGDSSPWGDGDTDPMLRKVLLVHGMILLFSICGCASAVLVFQQLFVQDVVFGSLLFAANSLIALVEVCSNCNQIVQEVCLFWQTSRAGRFLVLVFLAVSAMHHETSWTICLLGVLQLLSAASWLAILLVTRSQIPCGFLEFPQLPWQTA